MSAVDVSLYGLVDPEHTGGHDLASLTQVIARNGVSLVQLRDKQGGIRERIDRAVAVREALEGTGVPLIVNDRVDIALAAGAHGVHLGQDDMAVTDARRVAGPRAILGATIHSLAEADAMDYDAIDYVGLGGIFATTSKVNKSAPIGLEGLARIAARIRHLAPDVKICAIAGINADNAADVMRAGADGVAVISALSARSDPGEAAAALRRIVDDSLNDPERP